MSDELILLGKIGAPHGIKGDVRLMVYGDPESLETYGQILTSDGKSLKINRIRIQAKGVVAKFRGINSRNEAEAIKGLDLFVKREALLEPKKDEYYISDLIGCMVTDKTNREIGKIIAVPNFGAGDILEILPNEKKANQSFFVTFTKQNVPHIDLESRQVTIILPDETSERD